MSFWSCLDMQSEILLSANCVKFIVYVKNYILLIYGLYIPKTVYFAWVERNQERNNSNFFLSLFPAAFPFSPFPTPLALYRFLPVDLDFSWHLHLYSLIFSLLSILIRIVWHNCITLSLPTCQVLFLYVHKGWYLI